MYTTVAMFRVPKNDHQSGLCAIADPVMYMPCIQKVDRSVVNQPRCLQVDRMLSSSVLTAVVRNRQNRMTLESSVASKGCGSLCLYASSAWPHSTLQWLQGMIQVKFAELRLLMLARASKAANQALVRPG